MQRREFLRSSVGAVASAALAWRTGHAASAQFAGPDRTRRILYVLGQFDQATSAEMHHVVATLGPTSFNVLVLSFLQAGIANGKLHLSYNGNDFPSFAPEVPGLLIRLRSGFGARKRILISIGGWHHLATFAAIRSFGVAKFVRQLSDEVIVPLGLDGIDLDLEPEKGGLDQWMSVHHEYGRIIADLTNEYKRLHPTHAVTHAPISAVAAEIYAKNTPIFGLKGSLLEATRTEHGNNIDWLNVQFYEGGLVDGGDIAGFYRDSLAIPLAASRHQTSIEMPILQFLVPLFEPAAQQPLQFCQQAIAAIDRRCADLHAGNVNGVALWDYRQVAPTIDNWSQGLRTALHS